MKFTATLTALSVLLAGAATAAFAGCTITTSTSSGADAGIDDTNDASVTPTNDASTAQPAECPAYDTLEFEFEPAACSSFVRTTCCPQLTAFANAPVSDAGTSSTPTQYARCIDDARKQPPQEQTLALSLCDAATDDSIKSAYTAIEECAKTSTACPGVLACAPSSR